MQRISNGTQVSALPTPVAVSGTPGFFTSGNPGITAATIIDQDWVNMVQEELVAVVAAAGISLDKTNNAQVLAAIQSFLPKHYSFDVSAPPATPILLLPRDRCTIIFTNAASLPLHIASVPSAVYRVTCVLAGTNTTNSDLAWKPNDTTYTNAFSYYTIKVTDQALTGFGSASAPATFTPITAFPPFGNVPMAGGNGTTVSYFSFDQFDGPSTSDPYYDRGPSMQEFLVSTFTSAKMIKASTGILGGPASTFAAWNDTTTPWTSLGTISDISATQMSGTIIIERLA